ncbi:GNAT family N-acetyltransferase [Taibaiella lutea]|uniref:GNAT family N-acetyltransferase n=1 Tax=Taibaiella lutea TaxID=2608001 RepID=A0A5M6CVG7_9BACT|nr:GNAT family N-acetyltransferase [Taibaiella lutea]KAA5537209.1 GNAT family N-acetyltransferase [Taibaiella lutea]
MHSILIIATDHPFYQQVIQLRQRILRAPLGLNIYDDDLAAETDQLIFVFEEEQTVKGCVLMQHYDVETFKLRQMAVDINEQGKQIGRRLIEAAELYAIQLGKKNIILHARQTAVPFYEKLGYFTVGEIFYEVGLPHKKMTKALV